MPFNQLATFEVLAELPTSNTEYVQPAGVGYADYYIRSYYNEDRNIEQLPTAAPQGNGVGISSIVQIADPIKNLIVEWEVISAGDKPDMPEPIIQDNNIILLKRSINPRHMTILGDGVSTGHRVAGRYEYALIDQTKEVILAPLLPWIKADQREATLFNNSDFVHGLIGGITTPNEIS